MQTQYAIKELKKPEFEATRRLLCAIFNHYAAAVEKDIVNSLQEPSKIVTFVASAGTHIIGATQCHLLPNYKKAGRGYGLAWLGVAFAHRGQGIAHALVRHVEKYSLRDLGTKAGFVMLGDGTKRQNPASVFYEEMGYTTNHPWRHKSTDGDPILVKYLNKFRPGRADAISALKL